MNKENTDKKKKSPVEDKQPPQPAAEFPQGETASPAQEAAPESAQKEPAEAKEGPARGRIAVTYGRNQMMNKQVVSLIRELGVEPLVMQSKEHREKSVVEFAACYPDIRFVVAILSSDDWVYPKEGKPKDALLRTDQRVVFHLGFWIGKVGREHVFTLFYDQRSFRQPTEFFDVIYTPLDKEGLWKKELLERLKRAGISVRKPS